MERNNIKTTTLFIFTNVNSIDFTNIQVHRRMFFRLAGGKLSLEDEALISEMAETSTSEATAPRPIEGTERVRKTKAWCKNVWIRWRDRNSLTKNHERGNRQTRYFWGRKGGFSSVDWARQRFCEALASAFRMRLSSSLSLARSMRWYSFTTNHSSSEESAIRLSLFR